KNNPQPGLLMSVQVQRDKQGAPCIRVSDNGVGIPAASLPFIFNRFYRAAGGSGVRGTGLGLAIVRHAVEAHGLRISAASVPGRCTTFTIASPEH
ncbi:MAG: ATP-binding protein, partial [Akkermansia sp.]